MTPFSDQRALTVFGRRMDHQQGKYAEAEKLHLGVLKIRRNLLAENHHHTLGTIRGLIALYTVWGKPQEARKWFSELETAYANQSAAHQYTKARGIVNYDPATESYTLLVMSA